MKNLSAVSVLFGTALCLSLSNGWTAMTLEQALQESGKLEKLAQNAPYGDRGVEVQIRNSTERRVQRGPILVIERSGEPYISLITIIVKGDDNMSLASALLEAGFPKEMGSDGGVPSLDSPRVMTVEEYVQESIHQKVKNTYPKEVPPGVVIEPIPPSVIEGWKNELRKKVLADLGENFAVVYRYINTKK